MTATQPIRIAQTGETDARLAAQAFHAAVAQADMALVIFFCSSDYDLGVLGAEMHRLFGGTPVIGCTGAGEFGPIGYCEHGISGASFASGAFTVVTQVLDQLQGFEIARGQAWAQGMLRKLQEKAPDADAHNSFAFLLIDGLSVREETVARSFQHTLGKLPMFGGSAGDGLRFQRTHVYHDGQFQTDAVVLALVTTSLPYKLFKTQHFVATEERVVVTQADADKRIVREINGRPAAQEYARLLGIDVADLGPTCFATSPLVVLIDGANYVRAIQKQNPDHSLTFYCAIEEGLVLRMAKGVDMLANMEQAFAAIRADLGQPQLVLGCDCVLRSLELTQAGNKERAAQIFRDNNAIGFATYGEQFGGVHVNQTLAGIAIAGAGENQDA
ncbi:MAG TPA: nitric oxide-sensing protein NosP [Burkholderiaceae bacterium]|nr:nitric oxide-sensing protein NosP [Burkholderiaceae bacterium]